METNQHLFKELEAAEKLFSEGSIKNAQKKLRGVLKDSKSLKKIPNKLRHKINSAISKSRYFDEISSQDIVNLVSDSLNETGFTFFYKKVKEHKMLRTKGSLSIDDNNLVQEYEDKPQEDLNKFNAFWTAFAFRKRVFDNCIEFMEKSTLKHRLLVGEIKNTNIYKSKAIEVEDYIDLGTWEQIYKFNQL